MAKYDNGILGPFQGKVGPVVGRIRRGQFVMTSYRRHISQANVTDEQLLQRARFAVVSALTSAFNSVAQIGFKAKAWQGDSAKTPANIFFERTIDNAVSGTDPESVSVDHAKIQVADGNLPSVTFGSASFDEAKTVTVSFQSNSEVPGAKDDDSVYIVVYNPEVNQTVLSAPAKRSVKSASVATPGTWSGKQVHVYGFAVGEKNESSQSFYIGSGTMA